MPNATLRQVMLTFPVSEKQQYASGGLAKKAQEVRRGVGPSRDTVLLHVNPEEYDWMKKHFGPERINPETGLPQFGFFSDFFLPAAAVVASAFLGPAVGAAAGSALGLGLSSAAEAALGSGLIGAGIGGITGGAKGAVLGGLTAGVGSYALGPAGLNLVGGENSVLSGLGDKLGVTGSGGLTEQLGLSDLLPGSSSATTGTSGSSVASSSPSYPTGEMESLNELSKKAGTSETGLGSLFSGGNLTKYALPAAVLAGALGSGQKSAPSATATNPDKNYGTHLSNVAFNRTPQAVDVNKIAYGQGSNSFFKDNALPTVTAAQGRYVRGGGTGTSDSIPAKLSDGEYVIDAQTVSMLGDGSSDAGAKKLDQMREEIRKQKGGLLVKGKFPPTAKSPLSYIKGA